MAQQLIRLLILCGVFLAGAACLDEMKVEDETFPCRKAEDCIEDFECHPQRFVCVESGTVTSSAAPARDAGVFDVGVVDGG